MLNTPPPPPVQPPMYGYGGYPGYPQYPGYYGGQVPQGYGNYMGQTNPYMNNSYTQPVYQPNGAGYPNYMGQSNTGYMNQSFQQPQNNQQFNPYNSYKK